MTAQPSALTKNYRRQKAALTRALNSGDASRVTLACRDAFASFDTFGWPDDWARWQRAADDVQFAVLRGAGWLA